MPSRTTTVIGAAAVIALFSTGSAFAASQITSTQIKNDTIRSWDIRNGGVAYRDLNTYTQGQIGQGVEAAKTVGTKADASELEKLQQKVTDLQKTVDRLNNASGWMPTNGAEDGTAVTDANTVTLVLKQGNAVGSSVETTDLDQYVAKGGKISFHYTLADGAQCIAGAPRMYIVQQGDDTNTNSWDQNIADGSQCGTDGVVTFTAPHDGTIRAAGLVYDNSVPGTVTIDQVTVGGKQVSFQ